VAKILVVDDSTTVGITVEWALRDRGHTIQVVSDGLSALNALKAFDPDLVLLDIRLPRVNGFELCALIRKHPCYESLPIIMLSGLSNTADIQCALNAGADDYLVKPIDDGALATVVERHLSRVGKAAPAAGDS
jgi:DNA-binding response OmpR family regulator